jgi:DNA ligase (NAD+)
MNPLDSILRACADYYNGSPTMTDAEYDELVAGFAKKMPMLYDQWRASYIGPRPAHATPHPFRMLSLRGDNWDHFADFGEWLARMPKKCTYLVQPKVDGHAIAVTYRDGRLTRVATRGDGAMGKDITGLVLKSKSLPLVISHREEMHLTGELYIPLDAWNSADFSHPRNELCSVMNGATSPRKSAIAAVIHGVHSWNAVKLAQTEAELFAVLAQRDRLPLVPFFELEPRLLVQGFGATLRAYQDHFRAGNAPIDGVVVKVNNLSARYKVGESAVAPLWAYALKEYQTY